MSAFFDLQRFEQQVATAARTRRRFLLACFAALAALGVVVANVLFVAFGMFAGWQGVAAFVAGPLGALLLIGLGRSILGLATGTAAAVLHPGGAAGGVSTSAAEALFVSGQIDASMRAFDALRATHGSTARLLRAEVELHLGASGHIDRARDLLLRLRQAPDATRADELYVTQRLIDLYLGRLGEVDRAMVELRRLIARFPDTPDAAGAKNALDRLQRERAEG